VAKSKANKIQAFCGYYGKVAVDLANKPPPYIPIFLTLFKLYGGFFNTKQPKYKDKKQ
jgi:hypothetical protein